MECFLPSMPSNSHTCIETRSERKHTDSLELIQSQRDSSHPHQTHSPPLHLHTSDVQLPYCCCCCFLLTWHQSWIRFSPRSLRGALVSTFLSLLCLSHCVICFSPSWCLAEVKRVFMKASQLLVLPPDRDRGCVGHAPCAITIITCSARQVCLPPTSHKSLNMHYLWPDSATSGPI